MGDEKILRHGLRAIADRRDPDGVCADCGPDCGHAQDAARSTLRLAGEDRPERRRGVCPKCLGSDIHTQWLPEAKERYTRLSSYPALPYSNTVSCSKCAHRYTREQCDAEHLHEACRKCGYCWRTTTEDRGVSSALPEL